MSRRARGRLAFVLGGALCALLLVRCGDDRAGGGKSGNARGGATPRPAAILAYDASGCPLRALSKPPTPRNVLLICLDTLRADALIPTSGPTLMPRLAAWAKTGVTFTNATSCAAWTGPSVTSLLTGLPPSEHGARDFGSFRLVESVPTLAEVLACARWHTISYVGGVWVSEDAGVLQGFEVVRKPFSFGAVGPELTSRFGDMAVNSPWLLFLHTYEAHDPYGAPPDAPNAKKLPPPTGVTRATLQAESDGALAQRFLTDPASRPLFDGPLAAPLMDRVKRYFERGFAKDPDGAARATAARAAYVAGIRRLDDSLMDFLEVADREPALRDAIVIVTSDHGEGFGEHGSLHHGRRLYDELLRVPLIVRAPGWPAGLTIDAPVSTLDVAPTICELLGLPLLTSDEGESLSAAVRGGAGHPCVAEEMRTEAETGFPGNETLASIRDGRWKWILTKERGAAGTLKTEIYDLKADPGETKPLPGGAAVTPSLPFEEARGRRLRALGN